MKIKNILLHQNILQVALAEIENTSTLLLFPTRKSKYEAQKLYQEKWDFSEHKFLTMDEWKESLFISNKPILREEKRTLAFYQSLPEDAKKYFKIGNYSQSITFAQNFFKFWKEMTEELVAEKDIKDVLFQKQTAGDWQLTTFDFLTKIKNDYQKYLENTNFIDQLFIRNSLVFSNDIKKIVVVNQFYFTNFEKKLLKNSNKKVIILSQIPPEYFNEETLTITDFNAKHITKFCQNKMKLYTSAEPMQMITQLISNLNQNETIIDFQFRKQPYTNLLSKHKFAIPTKTNFSTTRVFRFFQSIFNIINSVNKKPFLFSLQSLIDAFSNDEFLQYFVKETGKREKLRASLFNLIDRDFKFVDFDCFDNSEFKQDFEIIFNFLQNFLQINELKKLLTLLKNDIDYDFLLASDKDKTNVVEVFFTALADFSSLEDIALVPDWKVIFPKNSHANLLKLWLDYLKAKEIKYNLDYQKNQFSITTLQDTRNLRFENISILNVVEGILPDKKHAQFLLSENQRKQLGLKTYEDITLRDKYYFYRLLACSRQISVFTMKNLQENIEISSFLEELKIVGLVEEIENDNFDFLQQNIFRELIEEKQLPKNRKIEDDFFRFKYNAFPENKLNLSFYKWEKLKNNPFEYYLEYAKKLKSRSPEIDNDFSNKLIGSIAHNVINAIIERIIEIHQSNKVKHNFIHNSKQDIDKAVRDHLQNNRNFKYISPHNFSNKYFENIFLFILKEGIENFFYRLHNNLKLSNKTITLFPETDKTMRKRYFSINDLDIFFCGRPDLRIHHINNKYIFDFKTGKLNFLKLKKYSQQLQFYESICYLIDSPTTSNELNSFLFFVEQKDLRSISKKINLKEEITKTIQKIIETDFHISEKKDAYEEVEITRRDLFSKIKTSI